MPGAGERTLVARGMQQRTRVCISRQRESLRPIMGRRWALTALVSYLRAMIHPPA